MSDLSQTGVEQGVLRNDSRRFGAESVDRNLAVIERKTNAVIDRMAKRLETALNKILTSFKDTVNSIEGGGGGGGGAGGGSAIGRTVMAATNLRTSNSADAAREAASGGGGSRIGITRMLGGLSGEGGKIGGTKMAGGLAAAGAAAAVAGINMGIDAANARFDRGRQGVLDADRLSVQYQQMTGLSQLGVSSTYRMPLTQYRLGAGGINALMGLEATTGLSGRLQGASVEAMRTLSGYQMSASDVAGNLASLASAPTVNRMFMMTGTSLIGVGGKQNTGMSVMQGIVRAAGLTSKDVVDSALLPGSVTRSKLSLMGVPPEMQTEVIQYAKANLQFQSKGGKGMYDPSREADRRKMGIEENFATQVEETQRLETKRDEQFYRRQVDNYAYLERQTQSLTRAFGALEDKLSGILGFTASNRIATTIFQGITGGGDPEGSSSGASTTSPAVQTARSNPKFTGLNPTFKQRLERMMADNPRVGIGTGVRSSDEQRRMFLSRYSRTSSPTNSRGEKNIQWDGSYWEHTSGAAAAPPGRSMHEIGLAADLTGDLDWVVANAHKYGLRSFHDVNNEPWHVQPSDLPGGRGEYERMGAPWGHGSGGAAPYDPNSTFGDDLDHPRGTPLRGGSTLIWGNEGYGDTTISGRVSRRIGGTVMQLDSMGGSKRYIGNGSKSATGTEVVTQAEVPGGMAPSGVDVSQWSKDFLNRIGAPLTEGNLQVMSAWIRAEWTRAKFNPLSVKSKPTPEALGVPQEQIELGWSDFNSEGVKSFASYNQGLSMNVYHKTKYWQKHVAKLKRGANPYEIADAIDSTASQWTNGADYGVRSILKNRHVPETSGDPSGPVRMASGQGTSSVSMVGGTTINLSPSITVMGSSAADLRKVASDLVGMIKHELERDSLRSI